MNVLNFLSYVIVTAITPGPNNLMVLSNASRLGFKKTVSFSFGVVMGVYIVGTICFYLLYFFSLLM